MNMAPVQRTEVVSGFIGKEHFDKSHTRVGEVVQRVHVIAWSSWCPPGLCGLFGFQSQWYYLLSISHALEYLHKQYKYNALFTTYLMYVLQCPNEWALIMPS